MSFESSFMNAINDLWIIISIVSIAVAIWGIIKSKPIAAILGIICFCIGFISSFYVSIPDVHNYTYSEASSTLQAVGFRVETDIDTPTDNQLVVSQFPEGGHHQWKHTTVYLKFLDSTSGFGSPASEVSSSSSELDTSGSSASSEDTIEWNTSSSHTFFTNDNAAPSGQVEVPNVVGLSIHEAASALCAAGLSPTSDINLLDPANDPETSGLHYYASAQDVEAGSFVSRGTAVHLSHSKSAPTVARNFSDFFQELTDRAYAQPQYSNESMNQFPTWFYCWMSVNIMSFDTESKLVTSSFAPEGLVPITLYFADQNAPTNLLIAHDVMSTASSYRMSFLRTGTEVYALLAIGDYHFIDSDGNDIGSVSVYGPGSYTVTSQPA